MRIKAGEVEIEASIAELQEPEVKKWIQAVLDRTT